MEKKLDVIEKQNKNLVVENAALKEKLLDMKYEQRKGNLIFEGLTDTDGETDLQCANKVRAALRSIPGLEEDFKIDKCHRIDGKYRALGTRRVLCAFNWFQDLQLVLRNRKKLPKGIFVNEDFPEVWVERRRVLKPIFNATKRTESLKDKTFLWKDTLIINGKVFTVGPTMNVLDANELFDVAATCQRSDEKTILFLGVHSVFSNLHPSGFRIGNTTFNCAEQMIRSEKAALFNDDVTQAKIMLESNPFRIKKLGSKVRNFKQDAWRKVAKRVTYEAVWAKFSQNDYLKGVLLNTGDVTIAESSMDSYWGTGLHLRERNALDERYWLDGAGALSEIYSRVRHDLKSAPN